MKRTKEEGEQVSIEETKKSSIGNFIRETRNEIAKVTWPTRKETIMNTVMIIVMALVTGVFFFGVDSFLGYAIGHLLGMNT